MTINRGSTSKSAKAASSRVWAAFVPVAASGASAGLQVLPWARHDAVRSPRPGPRVAPPAAPPPAAARAASGPGRARDVCRTSRAGPTGGPGRTPHRGQGSRTTLPRGWLDRLSSAASRHCDRGKVRAIGSRKVPAAARAA